MTVAIIDNRGFRPVIIGAGVQVVGALVAEAKVIRDAAAASAAAAALSEGAAESLVGPTYADTSAGIAGTVDGEFFAVDNGDGTVTIYLNDSEAAVAQRTLATTTALADDAGADLVGFSHSATYADETLGAKGKAKINVTDSPFNAVGDGVANNRAALLAADDYAYATGKELFFPAGIYCYTGRLPFRVNCSGEGETSVLKQIGIAGNEDTVTNEHPETGYAANLTFRALCFDGNNKTRGTHFVGGGNITVQDCFARNCKVGGITFYLMSGARAINNTIEDVTYDVGLTAADGIFFGDTHDCVAEGNTIKRFERIGIVSDTIGAGGSTNTRAIGNIISGASNCDLTTDEYNAGIWFEATSGGIIKDNKVSDITGNSGQGSGRIVGIHCNNVGDSSSAQVLVQGNTVELGRPDYQHDTAFVVSGSFQKASVVFDGNIARYCSRGLELPGGNDSIDVRRFTVDRFTRRTNVDGAIVMSLTSQINEITIDGLRVTNATDAAVTDDWGDIHLASVSGGSTLRTLTVRNCHDVSMMMTPNPAACLRLNVEGSSLLYGATSNLYCLSAMTVTCTGTVFTFNGRAFAGLMNQNVATGQTSRWRFLGCTFIGGDQDVSGAGLVNAAWIGCNFIGSGVRFNLTENGRRTVRFSNSSFEEYSATEGAIKINLSNTVTGLRFIVQGCDFIRSTDVTPIKSWGNVPNTVVLSDNIYNSTALTDLSTTSSTNNVIG